MLKTVTVTVPGTTSNLGPGFDCLGAALTLRNRFRFSVKQEAKEEDRGSVHIQVTGIEADRVTTDDSNLAYQAFAKFYQHIGQAPPSVQIEIHLEVPLARGLGSSATAIVGGVVGANLLANSPLSQEAVMALAIALEGHPDNVVPALIGGCQLAASSVDGTWQVCPVPWHSDVIPVVAIPNFELSTAEARRVLPQTYSRADAIFNMAHLGLLVRGLETGCEPWLRAALQDRIHQPYRQSLIPGYETLQAAAIAAGAYGLVISGAGPTLMTLSHATNAQTVADAMSKTWMAQGIESKALVLAIDPQGVIVRG